MIGNTSLTVHKADPDGRIAVTYPAWVLDDRGAIVLLAQWLRPTLVTSYTSFSQGDLLFETFYTDRPYNIFAVHDGGGLQDFDLAEHVVRRGRPSTMASPQRAAADFRSALPVPCPLKGYYVNFTRPAHYDPAASTLTWYDLALDLWVPAQGQPHLLDEADYAALDLAQTEPALHQAIQSELRTLWSHAMTRTGPFRADPL